MEGWRVSLDRRGGVLGFIVELCAEIRGVLSVRENKRSTTDEPLGFARAGSTCSGNVDGDIDRRHGTGTAALLCVNCHLSD